MVHKQEITANTQRDMDSGTWNRLTASEQSVVASMSKRFIKAVQASGTLDGWNFSQKFAVHKDGAAFVITDGTTPLSGIRHENRKVLEALMTDAVQNYGR